LNFTPFLSCDPRLGILRYESSSRFTIPGLKETRKASNLPETVPFLHLASVTYEARIYAPQLFVYDLRGSLRCKQQKKGQITDGAGGFAQKADKKKDCGTAISPGLL
jgi:hypothetical protein